MEETRTDNDCRALPVSVDAGATTRVKIGQVAVVGRGHILEWRHQGIGIGATTRGIVHMEKGSLAPASHNKERTVKSYGTVDIDEPMEWLAEADLQEKFAFEVPIGRRIIRGPPADIAPPVRRPVYVKRKISRTKRAMLLAQAGSYVLTIKRSRSFNRRRIDRDFVNVVRSEFRIERQPMNFGPQTRDWTSHLRGHEHIPSHMLGQGGCGRSHSVARRRSPTLPHHGHADKATPC